MVRRRADFLRVYSCGVKVVGRYIVVFALPREGDGCRLGITATRKIGGAVERNRARRRVKALFRDEPSASAGLTVDLVVNVRRGCAKVKWLPLAEDYRECLRRVRRGLGQRGS
jgi:ribonuclease P protein component